MSKDYAVMYSYPATSLLQLQVQVKASEQIRTKYTSQWTVNECMRELSTEMT